MAKSRSDFNISNMKLHSAAFYVKHCHPHKHMQEIQQISLMILSMCYVIGHTGSDKPLPLVPPHTMPSLQDCKVQPTKTLTLHPQGWVLTTIFRHWSEGQGSICLAAWHLIVEVVILLYGFWGIIYTIYLLCCLRGLMIGSRFMHSFFLFLFVPTIRALHLGNPSIGD